MWNWLARSGLLAALLLPGCESYDSAYGSRPLYAAHPGYGAPYYAPYYPAPGYYYGPPPRSSFSFGFTTGGHRHRHGHHHHPHRYHRHRW